MNVFVLFAFLILSLPALGQDGDIDKIARALSEGDASSLSAYFDRSVEVMINGQGDLLTRDKAKERLSGFFSKQGVASFAIVHKGAAKGNASNYCIGDLKTKEKTYRVYLYMKPTSSSEGALRIVELRFDS